MCESTRVNARFLQTMSNMALFRGMQQVAETVYSGAAIAVLRLVLILPFSSQQRLLTCRSCIPFAPKWMPLARRCHSSHRPHALLYKPFSVSHPRQLFAFVNMNRSLLVEILKKRAHALKVVKQVCTR